MGNKFEITIFNRKLNYDEQEVNFIRFRVFLQEVEKKACREVCKIFEKTGDFNKLWDKRFWVANQVDQIYAMICKEVFEYMKGLKGTENIKITDIDYDDDYDDGLIFELEHLYDYAKELEKNVEMNARNAGLSIEEKQKRRKEYEYKLYREIQLDFKDSVSDDINFIFVKGVDVLRTNNIKIGFDYKQTKAALAYKYLQSGTLDQKTKYDCAFDLFKYDPTKKSYYEYCMMEFPEELDRLWMIYGITGMAIPEDLLDKSLKNMFKKLSHDTEKETLGIKSLLDNIQNIVDIQNNTVVKKIDKLLAEFDLEARTFNNIVFQTREIRKEAEKNYNIFNEKYPNVNLLNEIQCREGKEWIAVQDFVPEVKIDLTKKLENRVGDIWIQEDAEKFVNLFKNVDIYSEESKELAKKIIQEIGKSEEKNLYIKALEGLNEENINQYKKYIEWTKKTFLQKYGIALCITFAGVVAMGIWGIWIGAIILIVQGVRAKKMKDIWDLLTVNGRVRYEQLSE